MLKKIFHFLRVKRMAHQLRKPMGKGGTRVGIVMNLANENQYNFTLETMQIADDDEILEIGFSNGKFFEKIITKANGIKLAGIDHSRKMLEEATINNPELIAEGKVNLFYGKSDRMPFAENSFDKVFCINVVYFWKNPQDHLNEIYRVLKPGGKFFTTIRSKESMQHMTFTKYRFTLYSAEDWKNILINSKLSFENINTLDEPDFKFDGMPLNVKSLCFEAKK
jgi:ubiquinone/menaquinone biosynthesis C-methylase UbiE